MKKSILKFGGIAGLIVGIDVVIMGFNCHNSDFTSGYLGMIIGFSSMIIAFSFIFIGIKNFRDNYNDGVISFGKAFKIGALIALMASTIYVVVWLIVYYNFMPDFMEKYTAQNILQAKKSGMPQIEINTLIQESKVAVEDYKNPLNVIWMTYREILPLGLIIAAIGALVMKRKNRKTTS
jgi:hypothetical protein